MNQETYQMVQRCFQSIKWGGESPMGNSSPLLLFLSQSFPVLICTADLQPEIVTNKKIIWDLAVEDRGSRDREAAGTDQKQDERPSSQPPLHPIPTQKNSPRESMKIPKITSAVPDLESPRRVHILLHVPSRSQHNALDKEKFSPCLSVGQLKTQSFSNKMVVSDSLLCTSSIYRISYGFFILTSE